jgi:hypothetical protein
MKQDDALLSMFPEDKPTWFETCTRHQKLNINSENCAFRWVVLYNYLGDQIKKNGMGRKCSMYGGGGVLVWKSKGKRPLGKTQA